MAVNPYGYQPITDGGTPRIVTGYAREALSGGYLVGASGPAGVVSSGVDSFAATDIGIFHIVDVTDGATADNFVGVCLQNVESGEPVAFATRGSFILQCSGADLLAGQKVGAMGEDNVGELDITQSGAYGTIGRAWTTGSEDDYVVVDIHG